MATSVLNAILNTGSGSIEQKNKAIEQLTTLSNLAKDPNIIETANKRLNQLQPDPNSIPLGQEFNPALSDTAINNNTGLGNNDPANIPTALTQQSIDFKKAKLDLKLKEKTLKLQTKVPVQSQAIPAVFNDVQATKVPNVSTSTREDTIAALRSSLPLPDQGKQPIDPTILKNIRKSTVKPPVKSDNSIPPKLNKEDIKASLRPPTISNKITKPVINKPKITSPIKDVIKPIPLQKGEAIDVNSNQIDLTRPVIHNKDGSISTERTITVAGSELGLTGANATKGVNLPQIFDGKMHTPKEAIQAFKDGKNPAVGVFKDIPTADKAAVQRSKSIGHFRELMAKPPLDLPPDPNINIKALKARSDALDKKYKDKLDKLTKDSHEQLVRLSNEREVFRTGGEITKDTLASIAVGIVDLAEVPIVMSNIVSLGATSNISAAIDPGGKTTLQRTAQLKNYVQSLKSDAFKKLQQQFNEKSQEINIANQKKYGNTFTKEAADYRDAFFHYLSDPTMTFDALARSFPQIFGSGGIGGIATKFVAKKIISNAAIDAGKLLAKREVVGTAKKQFTKEMAKQFTTNFTARKLASKASQAAIRKANKYGAISFVGVTEGASNAVQVKVQILNMSPDELKKTSPEYNKLIDSGLTHKEAVLKLANKAEAITFVVAGVLGAVATHITGAAELEAKVTQKITGIFTKDSIGAKLINKSAFFKTIAKDSGKEFIEESSQGASGQFASNLGQQQALKDNTQLKSGIGEQAGAGGAIGLASGVNLGVIDGIGKTTKAAVKLAVDGAIKVTGAKNIAAEAKQAKKVSDAVKSGDISNITDVKAKDYNPENAFNALALTPLKDNATQQDVETYTTNLLQHAENMKQDIVDKLKLTLKDGRPTKASGPLLKKLKLAIKAVQTVEAVNIQKNLTPDELNKAINTLASNKTTDQKDRVFTSMNSQDNISIEQANKLIESNQLTPEDKKRVERYIKVKEAINVVESNKTEANINTVHNDIINGSNTDRGFKRGLKEYRSIIGIAVNGSNIELAKTYLNNFKKFVINHNNKNELIQTALEAYKNNDIPALQKVQNKLKTDFGLVFNTDKLANINRFKKLAKTVSLETNLLNLSLAESTSLVNDATQSKPDAGAVSPRRSATKPGDTTNPISTSTPLNTTEVSPAVAGAANTVGDTNVVSNSNSNSNSNTNKSSDATQLNSSRNFSENKPVSLQANTKKITNGVSTASSQSVDNTDNANTIKNKIELKQNQNKIQTKISELDTQIKDTPVSDTITIEDLNNQITNLDKEYNDIQDKINIINKNINNNKKVNISDKLLNTEEITSLKESIKKINKEIDNLEEDKKHTTDTFELRSLDEQINKLDDEIVSIDNIIDGTDTYNLNNSILGNTIIAPDPINNTILDINNLLQTTNKNIDSLLHKIPNLFENYRNKDEQTLNLINELLDTQELKVLKKLSDFELEFKKALLVGNNKNPVLGLRKANKFVHEDLIHLFFKENTKDSNKLLDPNMVSQMAINSLLWLGTRGLNTINMPDNVINTFLGMDTNATVSNEAKALLGNAGLHRAVFVESLGRDILKELGLKAIKDIKDGAFQAKLEITLGQVSLATLIQLDLVEFKVLDAKEILNVTPVESKFFDRNSKIVFTAESKTKTKRGDTIYPSSYFVRIKTTEVTDTIGKDKITHEEPISSIAEIVNDINLIDTVSNKISGTDKAYKGATFTEPLKNTNKIKGSTTEITNAYKLNVDKYQNTPLTLNNDNISILEKLSSGARMLIFGSKQNIKEITNVNTREGHKARNNNINKNITETLSLVNQIDNKDDGLGRNTPFYVGSSIINNLRANMNSSGTSIQGNTVARFLLSPEKFKIKIDLNNKDHKLHMFYFKLAVAEGMGIDTKDQINFVHALDELMNSELMQNAIKEINKAKKRAVFNEAIIVEAINKAGGNGHSFASLIAWSNYQEAKNSFSNRTFNTDIFTEIDGISNGTMIGLIQLMGNSNQQELLKKLARVGIYINQPYNNVGDYLSNGNLDTYQNIANNVVNHLTDFKNHIDGFNKNLPTITKIKNLNNKKDKLINKISNNEINPKTNKPYKSGKKFNVVKQLKISLGELETQLASLEGILLANDFNINIDPVVENNANSFVNGFNNISKNNKYNSTQLANIVLSGLKGIVGQLSEKDAVLNTIITKLGRDFSKPAVIKGNFLASDTTIIDAFVRDQIKDIYEKLSKFIEADDMSSITKLVNNINKVINPANFEKDNVSIKNIPEAKNFKFSEPNLNSLKKHLKNTYGAALSKALADEFKYLQSTKELLSSNIKVAGDMFTVIFNRKIKEAIKEKGSELNQIEFDKLVKSLDKLFPSYQTLLTKKGNRTGISAVGLTSERQTNNPNYVASTSVAPTGKFLRGTSGKGQGLARKGLNKFKDYASKFIFKDKSLAALVAGTISIDAAIMSKALGSDIDIISFFDGAGVSVTDAAQLKELLNKAAIDVLMKDNLSGNIADMAKRVFDEFNKIATEEDKHNFITKTITEANPDGLKFYEINNNISELTTTAKDIFERKNELLKEHMQVIHYNDNTSPIEINKPNNDTNNIIAEEDINKYNTVKEKLSELPNNEDLNNPDSEQSQNAQLVFNFMEENKVKAEIAAKIDKAASNNSNTNNNNTKQSSPLNIDVNNFNADQTIDISNKLSDMSPTGLFDLLDNIGSIQENTIHKTRLKAFLKVLTDEVVEPFRVRLKNEETATRGAVKAREVFIIANDVAALNGIEMSPQEVYVHEIVHMLTAYALDNNTFLKNELRKIFRIVKNDSRTTWKLFLGKNGDINNKNDVKAAKARFDYIFNNDTGIDKPSVYTDTFTNTKFRVNPNNFLHEFLAHATTNEAFMDHISSLGIGINNTETKNNSNKSLLEKIFTIFNRVLQTITHILGKTKKLRLDDRIMHLAEQLANNDHETKNIITQKFDFIDKLENKAGKAIQAFIKKPIKAAAKSKFVKNSRSKALQNLGKLVEVLPTDKFKEMGELLLDTRRRMGITSRNIVDSLFIEMLGTTPNNAAWHKLNTAANRDIDQARKAEQKNVTNSIIDSFGPEGFTKEESIAMTKAVLKTELYEIYHKYGYENIIKLLSSDQTYLDIKIKENIDKLTQFGNKNKFYYQKMANSLGHFMVTGNELENSTPLNAKLISQLGNTNFTQTGDISIAENIIEELATLYALKYTESNHKDNVRVLMKRENTINTIDNGITFTMQMALLNKREANKQLFTNSEGLMIKGYIKELYDPNRGFKIGTIHEKDALSKEGYVYYSPVPKDKLDPTYGDTDSDLHLYLNKNAIMVTRNPGISSITTQTHKGQTIIQSLKQSDKFTPVSLGFQNVAAMKAAKDKNLNAVFSSADTTVKGNTAIALRDANGEVVSYRYMINEFNKDTLLNKNNSFEQIIGHTSASILDKVAGKRINELIVDQAKKDFDKSFSKNKASFTFIGLKSPSKRLREIYQLMPRDIRENAKNTFGVDGLYIRDNLIDLVFGYRKFELMELRKHLKKLHNSNIRILNHIGELLDKFLVNNKRRIAGAAWTEFIHVVKDALVIKFLSTIKNNIISNTAILLVDGVKLSDLISWHIEAILESKKYQRNLSKINALRKQLKAKDIHNSSSPLFNIQATKVLKGRIGRLDFDLSTSPVRELNMAGVYQTIVEDIAPDDENSTYKGKLENWVSPYTAKVPGFLKNAGKQVFLTHDTQAYKFLRDATQISDFVARFVMHKNNIKNKNMSFDNSVSKIIRTFINYDLPTHRGIQWGNDVGLLFFTKFLFRIQRIIIEQGRENPGRMMALLGLQALLGNFADITDTNLLTGPGLNVMGNPLDMFAIPAETPIIKIFMGLTG